MYGSKNANRYHVSILSSLLSDTLVIIPTFNNPSYTNRMINQLTALNCRNIMIVDSCSTSMEMQDLLFQLRSKVKIVQLAQNYGPHHVIYDAISYEALPSRFCITDPDLEFNTEMSIDFLEVLFLLTRHFKVGKAGLALRIDDKSLMKQRKFSIHSRDYFPWEWEQQFWTEKLGTLPDGSPVFKADIDTTFAFYNKEYFDKNSFGTAVRVAGRFTCRHLPWYVDDGMPEPEKEEYRATQKFSFHVR